MSKQSQTLEEKLAAMDPGKRDRMLNAAMAEFCKGYKNASTDRMVAAAGISKGLLFHYFGSKKRLLHYLFDHARQLVVEELVKKTDFSETDFLQRLWQIVLAKMDLSYRFPAVFDFIAAVYFGEEPEFLERREQLYHQLDESWRGDEKLFWKGIDQSLFRQDVDPGLVMNTVRYTLTAYAQEVVGKNKTMDAYRAQYDRMLADMQAYMAFFRKTMYRDGG